MKKSEDSQAVLLPLSLLDTVSNIRGKEAPGIEELAESIRRNGLMQALVVARGKKGRFTLVAGARRLAALKLLGEKHAPARIVDADSAQIAVLRLIENIQREELSGADEVRAVAALLPIFGCSQSSVSQAIGKSPTYVSRCVRAAALLASLTCDAANIGKSVLFELAESSDPEPILRQIRSGKIPTVREIRAKLGAAPGGRASARPLIFNENRRTGAFILKIYFSEALGAQPRREIIEKLRAVLKRLEED